MIEGLEVIGFCFLVINAVAANLLLWSWIFARGDKK